MTDNKHIFRFWGQKEASNNGLWSVTGDEFRHLSKILRITPGTLVEVFDGRGGVIRGVVQETSKSQALVREDVVIEEEAACASNNRTAVAVGALKYKSIDTIIAPLVELGTDELHIFLHEGVAKERLASKTQERWSRLVLSAAKQSKRSRLMRVETWGSLSHFAPWAAKEFSFRYVLSPSASRRLGQIAPNSGRLCVLMGSEKGLGLSEQALLREHQFIEASLGPHILTSRTAAIAAAALICPGES